ncbi:MAG: hypothetical protein A2126_01685 [Candidatus Woykebacteria bacterium GWB1_45_5]|uniref:Uncharacterized protein n=1 Tax=Candidatus Woykebacteria bacterium GWB1_45_5 TaxID=1802592 RepID=A0A1G1W8P5_9BACT|nr:MAG: hypothetical protein A2126_01685 [Candidatus Woykebacteria bacterium GWB1_45_5]
MERGTGLIKSKNFVKLSLIILGISVIVVGVVLWRLGGSSTEKAALKSGGEQQLIEGFPATLVYPNANFKDSEKRPHFLGDFSYHGTWETTDRVSIVMAWYLEELPQEGWFIDDYPADKKAENIQFIDGHKEEKPIQVSVIKDQNSGLTQIVIEYPAVKAGIEAEEDE